MTTGTATPPIPARLLGRPTVGGRVIPWVQVRLADGGVDFRARHTTKLEHAWTKALCQLDGQPLDGHRFALLGGPDNLADLVFDEAPLHPECARYTAQACEMIAGRRSHYAAGPSVSEGPRGKQCWLPGCDCDGWAKGDGGDHRGKSAHAWYVVWARDYGYAATPDGRLRGGAVSRADVLGVRVVTPDGPHPWRRLPPAEIDALITDPVADREGR